LGGGGIPTVQVINEFASVAVRKLQLSIAEIREFLATIRTVCKVVPMTEETHEVGLKVVERYGLSVYDAMMMASALLAGCKTLVTEDMQKGQIFEGKLQVRNPLR